MKEVRAFIVADLVVLLVKVLGGILTHSYTMIASGVYDVALILISLVTIKLGENKKYKGIISSVLGILIIILGLGIIFISFVNGVNKVSLFILFFILLSIIVRYIVSCFFTNISYQKKKGLLTYGKINSTYDFIGYGIMIVVLILSKVSKWIDLLKYVDRIGTIIIAGFVIYKGIIIVVNSIKYLEDKEIIIDEKVNEEITKRAEVKKLDKLEMKNFGGVRHLQCNIMLKDGISMIDVNTFIVTLQDYLLKIADVVKINLVDKKVTVKKKEKVRSLKQDARNSRSGNSKTNTKKKNTKQKNKKR